MPFPYSLDDYIKEVKEYCYKNEIIRPHVVAHSFGARIAVKQAYCEPYYFNKLVLTGAAGLKPKFSIKKSAKRTAFLMLKKFVPKEKLKRFYSKDYLALSPIMQKSFIKIVSEHLDYTLSGIKNQTLLVFGALDNQTPLYMAKRFNNGIAGSRLIILKNAGHFAFIDKPLKFNAEVKEFLLSN